MDRLHEKAMSFVKDFLRAQASLIQVLQEIDQGKAYREWGYSSLWDYCLHGLRLAESDAETFIRVSRKAREVPELKAAIQRERISLSSARRICSVIDSNNAQEWIRKAALLPQRQLEREIVKVRPTAKFPDRLIPILPETTALQCSISVKLEEAIRRIQDLESKRKRKACTLEDTLSAMAEFYLAHKDPLKKAKDSIRVDAYDRRAFNGPNFDKKITMVESKISNKPSSEVKAVEKGLERHSQLGIDSKTEVPVAKIKQVTCRKLSRLGYKPQGGKTVLRRASRHIPAREKNAVLKRDKGQCSFIHPNGRRCEESRWMELHHIKPVSKGGENIQENIKMVCWGHHKVIHRIMGKKYWSSG